MFTLRNQPDAPVPSHPSGSPRVGSRPGGGPGGRCGRQVTVGEGMPGFRRPGAGSSRSPSLRSARCGRRGGPKRGWPARDTRPRFHRPQPCPGARRIPPRAGGRLRATLAWRLGAGDDGGRSTPKRVGPTIVISVTAHLVPRIGVSGAAATPLRPPVPACSLGPKAHLPRMARRCVRVADRSRTPL